MAWWRKKVVFPLKRALVAVAARIKARKQAELIGRARGAGGGILKLHDEVQTCGYEDVQVMWEMVRRSELEVKQQEEEQRQRRRQGKRHCLWRPAGRRSRRTSNCPDPTGPDGTASVYEL